MAAANLGKKMEAVAAFAVELAVVRGGIGWPWDQDPVRPGRLNPTCSGPGKKN
jgi:hypothetical protein